MSILVAKITESMASDVWFDSDMMHVRLLDGREISVPLEWFPKLGDATNEQRKNGGLSAEVWESTGTSQMKIFRWPHC
jgi:hypothetical protein